MELQLKQRKLDCLKQLTNQIRQEEQTQEIKLGDSMPDVGRVLGAWGQVLLRGKQWNHGNAGASGGVMAWVLYAPEDGSQERCLETWIPFQTHWDLPQTQHDGMILAACNLKSIDARLVSARKILVRACVSMMGQTYEPVQMTVYESCETEPDVQILERNYPIRLPKEAGEKVFELEEDLCLPSAAPPLEHIICYDMHPELVDQKVMGDKVVFRGTAWVHLLYHSTDGSIQSWDFEIPFSQYADLEQDIQPEADVKVIPVVTGLELENKEGCLKLHASLAGQYLVHDRQLIKLVDDAYSNRRQLELQRQSMEIPLLLDDSRTVVRAEAPMPSNCSKVLDTAFTYDQPQLHRSGDQVEVMLSGSFQTVFLDEEQSIHCGTSRWESSMNYRADQQVQVHGMCVRTGRPQSGGILTNDLAVELCAMSESGLTMVSAMELGQLQPQDPQRPSLLLRRMDGSDLWNIAKNYGSTVCAIMQANGLSQEPEQGKMLLIPVV